jgi:hypothetical protein
VVPEDIASAAGAPAGGNCSVSSGFAWLDMPGAAGRLSDWQYRDWAIGRSCRIARRADPRIDGGNKASRKGPCTPERGAEVPPAKPGPWARKEGTAVNAAHQQSSQQSQPYGISCAVFDRAARCARRCEYAHVSARSSGVRSAICSGSMLCGKFTGE